MSKFVMLPASIDEVGRELAAQESERKRIKAKNRIAKMKAGFSGQMRRRPLEGRAAVDFIRSDRETW